MVSRSPSVAPHAPSARSSDDERVRLVAENDRLRGERDQLRAENERLRDRVARLEGKVEELRRCAKRQAAPFSRGEPRRRPRRPGRRPGAAYGTKAHRPAPGPELIDETLTASLIDRCDCGGEIRHERTEYQHQEELPQVRPIRRRIAVHIGHCSGCGRRHQGRHRAQTSDALGAAASQLGPGAVARATQLNKELGLSPAKTAQVLLELCGISVTPGGVSQAVARQGRALQPTYGALVEGVRASAVVSPDETGWRVAAQRAWLWAFVGERVTVYLIASGRGYEQAETILGASFSGVLERDGWAPYRRFEHASHQTCVAHLLRRCTEMIADSIAGQARIPHAVRRLLLDALAARDRSGDALAGSGGEVIEGEVVEIDAEGKALGTAGRPQAPHGLPAPGAERAAAARSAPPASADDADEDSIEPAGPREPSAALRHPAPAQQAAALEQRLDALLERSPTHAPNRRLLAHLRTERDNLLTFLTAPGVEATNWRAEHAIRPAVVNRKSWGGNRSWAGARTQQVTMSVIRTARQQGVCPIELMAAAQREPQPKATELLRIPARASPAELSAAA